MQLRLPINQISRLIFLIFLCVRLGDRAKYKKQQPNQQIDLQRVTQGDQTDQTSLRSNTFMTQVFYFGESASKPIIDKIQSISDIIECVSFNPAELKLVEEPDEKRAGQNKYRDYVNMISNLNPSKLNFEKVVCGFKTTFLIDDRKELWGFGSSLNGQLGMNKMKYHMKRPFNLSRFTDLYFSQVSVSSTHSLAVSTNKKLYAWGSTQFSCLGESFLEDHCYAIKKSKKNLFVTKEESNQSIPQFREITCGEHFTLLVCNNKLFSYGKEDKGRLGCGSMDIKQVESPTQISLPISVKEIKGVSCGQNHCLLWDQDGMIYSWGDGSDGKLGHTSVSCGFNYLVVRPQQIKALEENRIIQASCGYRHSCAITFKGEIFTWGRTNYNSNKKDAELPLDIVRPRKISSYFSGDQHSTKVQSGSLFIKIASYAFHNAAIDQKGYLYTWGQNSENCLGHGSRSDCNFPQCVEDLSTKKVIDVGCGHNFTVVITTSQENQQAFQMLKEFKSTLLRNATENIAKIKQYCLTQLKVKIENSMQAQKTNSAPIEQIVRIRKNTRTASQHSQAKAENREPQEVLVPHPRSISMSSIQNLGRIQSATQRPVSQSKFSELLVKEQNFESDMKRQLRALKFKQDSSSVPSKSRPQSVSSARSVPGSPRIIQHPLNQSNVPNNEFFKYENNRIVFDTVHEQLDKQYHNFQEAELHSEKTPRTLFATTFNSLLSPRTTIDNESERRTRREKMLEVQQRAEERRRIGSEVKKGIVIDPNSYKKEIEIIYKECQAVEALEKPKQTLFKYIREKSDSFRGQRTTVTPDMRAKFNEVKNGFATSQNQEANSSPNRRIVQLLIRSQISASNSPSSFGSQSARNPTKPSSQYKVETGSDFLGAKREEILQYKLKMRQKSKQKSDNISNEKDQTKPFQPTIETPSKSRFQTLSSIQSQSSSKQSTPRRNYH